MPKTELEELQQLFDGKTPVAERESDGAIRWKVRGVMHRADGPAYDLQDGNYIWFLYGRKHREDGPAEKLDDYTAWYKHGQLHRDGGPAEERGDGLKKWWRHNKLHRIDGPAVINPDGSEEWWQNGERLSDAEAQAAQEKIREQFRQQADAVLAPFRGTMHAVAAPEKAAFKKHARPRI